MGTNFYLKRKLNRSRKQDLIKLISDGNLYDAKDLLDKTIEETHIHIGKRSCGWKFLWNANDFKYFDKSRESLFQFLKSGQIVDEYGSEFSFEQFMNDEISDFLYGDDLVDLESYYKESKDKSYYFYSKDTLSRYQEEHDVDVNSFGEFYIDDFRFTITTEFS